MRTPPLLVLGLAAALFEPRIASATECSSVAVPCVDAEPLWLPPGADSFTLLPSTDVAPPWQLGFDLAFLLRLRPAVLLAPAPSRDPREIDALGLAADGVMGWTFGLNYGLELSWVTPLGLYQSGAGIKGVTHQTAPPISQTAVHDPRLGLGYAFGKPGARLGAKARIELKLPLGDADALASEPSAVASPSFALSWGRTGWLMAAEVGARLRRPSQLFGSRIGSQAWLALGVGYAFSRPRLSFSVEGYALPSLVAGGDTPHLPSEWLATAVFSPAALASFSFGLGGGTGLPLSSNGAGKSFAAFGVPALRLLAFARFAPQAD